MRKWISLLLLTGIVIPVSAQQVPVHHQPYHYPGALENMPTAPVVGGQQCDDCSAPPLFDTCNSGCRKPFASDRAFSGFIGPISNPTLAKDPRALTEVRLLFVNNWIPNDHPFGGGDFQAYGAQVRVALTERLSFIADKDGYVNLNPDGAPDSDGWLNIAVGLKYALIRDVENQRLWTAGFQYEVPSGEAAVFQGHGPGFFTLFSSFGQEFGNCAHFIGNVGFQLPLNSDFNSSFSYVSLHVDRQIAGFIYPLFEVNWFHYFDGGARGIPAVVGEGDSLLNIGTTGVNGNDLVTAAVGLKAVLGQNLDVGIAYETPLTGREDLLDHRILVEAILRY